MRRFRQRRGSGEKERGREEKRYRKGLTCGSEIKKKQLGVTFIVGCRGVWPKCAVLMWHLGLFK